MKAFKILLTLFIFCFFATGVSSAQSTSEKTDNYCFFMVECNGVEDYITGPAPRHQVNHTNRAGDFDWVNSQFISNQLVSMATGEAFKVNFIVKTVTVVPGAVFQISKHYNLVGDQGTHILYSVVIIYDWTSGYFKSTVVKEKMVCL